MDAATLSLIILALCVVLFAAAFLRVMQPLLTMGIDAIEGWFEQRAEMRRPVIQYI